MTKIFRFNYYHCIIIAKRLICMYQNIYKHTHTIYISSTYKNLQTDTLCQYPLNDKIKRCMPFYIFSIQNVIIYENSYCHRYIYNMFVWYIYNSNTDECNILCGILYSDKHFRVAHTEDTVEGSILSTIIYYSSGTS